MFHRAEYIISDHIGLREGTEIIQGLKNGVYRNVFLIRKVNPLGMIFDLAASYAFFECFFIYKGKKDDTRRLKTSYPQTFSIW